jgi:predicted Fe-Mo cluster-binding NifX family protein
MNVAFSFLDNRIAPVFDSAQRILVLDAEGGSVRSETVAKLVAEEPLDRARALATMNVSVLVCGAISGFLQQFLEGQGIQVIPFRAGSLVDIKAAWLQSRLDSEDFLMPGCRRRGEVSGLGRGMNPSKTRENPAPARPCPRCGHRCRNGSGTPSRRPRCPECGAVLPEPRSHS